MRRVPLLFTAILLSSCTAMEHRMLNIRAIGTNQDDLRAVVLIDDQVMLDADGRPQLTPTTLPVTFRPDDTGKGYRPVKVEVRSVVEKDGEIVRGLGERESLPFKPSWRKVLHNDPDNTLFILVEDPDYEAPRN